MPDRRAIEERRQFPRYTPARSGIWIGWHGPKGFGAVQARLLDISVGGSSMDVEGELREGQPVWVKANDSEYTEWTRASVVGIGAGDGEGTRIRLKFAEGCPYDLFRAAVVGAPPSPAPVAARPPDVSAAPVPLAAAPEPPSRSLPVAAAAVAVAKETPLPATGTFEVAVGGDSALRATFARSRRYSIGG